MMKDLIGGKHWGWKTFGVGKLIGCKQLGWKGFNCWKAFGGGKI